MTRGKAPTRRIEQELWAAGYETIVGIDEVGRGAWAGPLMVGAAILPPDKRVLGVRDSKLLTARTREELSTQIRARCDFGVGVVSQHMLNGPAALSCSARCTTAPTQSRSEIIAMCWRPLPSRPPRPSLKSGTSCFIGGLRRSITGEVRSTHTREPAAAAGAAAASHSRLTSVSSASPRLSEVSVSSWSPWSP